MKTPTPEMNPEMTPEMTPETTTRRAAVAQPITGGIPGVVRAGMEVVQHPQIQTDRGALRAAR